MVMLHQTLLFSEIIPSWPHQAKMPTPQNSYNVVHEWHQLDWVVLISLQIEFILLSWGEAPKRLYMFLLYFRVYRLVMAAHKLTSNLLEYALRILLEGWIII